MQFYRKIVIVKIVAKQKIFLFQFYLILLKYYTFCKTESRFVYFCVCILLLESFRVMCRTVTVQMYFSRNFNKFYKKKQGSEMMFISMY